MTIVASEISVVATMKDEVSSELAKIDKGLEDHKLKIAAAGVAVASFAAAAGRDWDKARDTIVQGTGATGEALDELLESFKNLAGTVAGTSNESVASALADVSTKFKLSGKELEELTTQTLKAKQAFGEFEIEDFGRALTVFGEGADEAAGRLDLFGTIAKDTGAPINKLISDIQTFGPVTKNLGLNIHETSVFFGKLHESGIDLTRVMPGLNQAMRKAAREGVTDLRGHLDDVIKSIKNAEDSTEALNIAQETFGAEGAQRMISAIRSGVLPSLSDLSEHYTDVIGHTNAAYDETVSLGDQFLALKNKALAIVGPIGDVAAGTASIATAAVLAGPNLAKMGSNIATKLLPFLAGPGGIVLLLAGVATGIYSIGKAVEERAIEKFANQLKRLTLEEVKNKIVDLEGEIAQLEKTLKFEKSQTFADPNYINELKRKLEEKNRVLGKYEERLEETAATTDTVTEAVDSSTVATEELGVAHVETSKKVEESTAKIVESIEEVNRFLENEALEAVGEWKNKWKELGDELPGLLIQEVENNPKWDDLRHAIPEFTFDPPLYKEKMTPAAEAAMKEAKDVATRYAERVSKALLDGQSLASAMGNALQSELVGSAVAAGGRALGEKLAAALGPVLGERLGGYLAGALGGVVGSIMGSLISSINAALTGARYSLAQIMARFPGAGTGTGGSGSTGLTGGGSSTGGGGGEEPEEAGEGEGEGGGNGVGQTGTVNLGTLIQQPGITNPVTTTRTNVPNPLAPPKPPPKPPPRKTRVEDDGGDEDLEFRASGGPVSPNQGYIVGERGPELFQSSTPGNIIPNHMMSQTINQGPITVKVEVDGREIASAVVRHTPDVLSEDGLDF